MTFTGPEKSPSRRLTSTVSSSVPSNRTYGWPSAEFTFTLAWRVWAGWPDAGGGDEPGALPEMSLGQTGATPVCCGGEVALDSAEIRSVENAKFEAKRELYVSSRSCWTMGSGGGVGGALCPDPAYWGPMDCRVSPGCITNAESRLRTWAR